MPKTLRSLRLPFVALIGAILLAASGVQSADAAARFHTRLLKSSPAKDTVLTTSPAAIELTFSESVEMSVSKIQLLGADQKPVAMSALTRDAKGSAATLVARITTPLAAGTYTVNWTAASADGHPVKGTYGFTVRTQ